MKKHIKIAFFIFVLIVIALLFVFFNSRFSIIGKVIEFSDEQESSGNVLSIIIISFIVLGFIVILTLLNVVDNFYVKKRNKQELDLITGKNKI